MGEKESKEKGDKFSSLKEFGASKFGRVVKMVSYTLSAFLIYGVAVRPLLDSQSDVGYFSGWVVAAIGAVTYAWLMYKEIREL